MPKSSVSSNGKSVDFFLMKSTGQTFNIKSGLQYIVMYIFNGFSVSYGERSLKLKIEKTLWDWIQAVMLWDLIIIRNDFCSLFIRVLGSRGCKEWYCRWRELSWKNPAGIAEPKQSDLEHEWDVAGDSPQSSKRFYPDLNLYSLPWSFVLLGYWAESSVLTRKVPKILS